MNRPRAVVGTLVVRRFVIFGGVSSLLRLLLEREQRRFGFARGFERVAHGRIHVITPANEWHGASRKA